MGSPLSPIIANIFMEHSETQAIQSVQLQPSLWLRYVDDTFVIWPHSREELDKFLQHINQQHQNIRFTMVVEQLHPPSPSLMFESPRKIKALLPTKSTGNRPTPTYTFTTGPSTTHPSSSQSPTHSSHEHTNSAIQTSRNSIMSPQPSPPSTSIPRVRSILKYQTARPL